MPLAILKIREKMYTNLCSLEIRISGNELYVSFYFFKHAKKIASFKIANGIFGIFKNANLLEKPTTYTWIDYLTKMQCMSGSLTPQWRAARAWWASSAASSSRPTGGSSRRARVSAGARPAAGRTESWTCARTAAAARSWALWRPLATKRRALWEEAWPRVRRCSDSSCLNWG